MRIIFKAILIPTSIFLVFTAFFAYAIVISSQSANFIDRQSASIQFWLSEYLIAFAFVVGIGSIYCYSELRNARNVEGRKK